jgi:transposase-like protein
METEVAGLIGAERHERSAERAAYSNGYRTRTWDTRVGTIELAIPKVRPGTYFPSLLQPRRRAEHALLAVVQEAYVHGVSTRKVDELVRVLGVRASRSPRCRASAPNSTPRLKPSARGRSRASIRTRASTRRITRCASLVG